MFRSMLRTDSRHKVCFVFFDKVVLWDLQSFFIGKSNSGWFETEQKLKLTLALLLQIRRHWCLSLNINLRQANLFFLD